MNIEEIVARLHGVRRTGHRRFVALCPVHKEKTPSLALEDKNGQILVHCFGCGCGIDEFADAIGVRVADLFPDEPKESKGKMRFDPFLVLECLEQEAMILRIASHDLARGYQASDAPERIELAHKRIAAARQMVWGRR